MLGTADTPARMLASSFHACLFAWNRGSWTRPVGMLQRPGNEWSNLNFDEDRHTRLARSSTFTRNYSWLPHGNEICGTAFLDWAAGYLGCRLHLNLLAIHF